MRLLMLLSVSLCCFFIGFVNIGTILASPNIKLNLHLSSSQMQWIMTLRYIALSSFVVFMGRISDSIGRANVYILGVFTLVIGAILLSIGTDYWLVIIGSIFIGLGAAAAVPCGLAIVKVIYPQEKTMLVLSVVMISALTGASLGSLFGGMFSLYVNWRMVFWVALLGYFISLAIGVSSKKIEDKLELREFKLDYIGTFLLAAFSVCFMVLFAEYPYWGYSSTIITLISVTPVLFIFFIISQIKVKYPIFEFSLFKSKDFFIGSLMNLFSQAAFVSFIYVTVVAGMSKFAYHNYSVFIIGVLLFPFLASIIFVSPAVVIFMKKLNLKHMILVGNILVFSGLLVLMFINYKVSYAYIWWIFVMMGVGLGISWIFLTPYAYSTVPKNLSGQGAGMFEILRFFGNAMGICIVESWFRGTFISDLKLKLSEKGITNIDVKQIFESHYNHGVDGGLSSKVMSLADSSFIDSYLNGITVCMVFAAITVFLSIFMFVGKR